MVSSFHFIEFPELSTSSLSVPFLSAHHAGHNPNRSALRCGRGDTAYGATIYLGRGGRRLPDLQRGVHCVERPRALPESNHPSVDNRLARLRHRGTRRHAGSPSLLFLVSSSLSSPSLLLSAPRLKWTTSTNFRECVPKPWAGEWNAGAGVGERARPVQSLPHAGRLAQRHPQRHQE